jgi:hypothetical protein
MKIKQKFLLIACTFGLVLTGVCLAQQNSENIHLVSNSTIIGGQRQCPSSPGLNMYYDANGKCHLCGGAVINNRCTVPYSR